MMMMMMMIITQFLTVKSTRVSSSTNPGLDDGDDNFGSDDGDKYLIKCLT